MIKEARGTREGPPALAVRRLTVAYGGRPVLWDVDVTVARGCFAGIVGPNGAGKTTLLKAILGLVPAGSGRVSVFGGPLAEHRGAVAWMPQRESVDWEFPVNALDVAAMGLYRRIGWFRRVTARHRRQALEALDRVGVADLAARQIGQLSGGQRQRVFLARALAQDARLLLMDEPLAGVDAASEQAIFEVFTALKQEGRTVVAVHHDLESAADWFDHLVLLNAHVVASGPTAEVLSDENLQRTYGAHPGRGLRARRPERARDDA